jgi:hypothetical protein
MCQGKKNAGQHIQTFPGSLKDRYYPDQMELTGRAMFYAASIIFENRS